MDLERNITKIEKLIADDKLSLAIQVMKELLDDGSEDYFKSEANSLLSLEARFTRNERSYNVDAVIDREEYLLELNKIKKGLNGIRDAIQQNSQRITVQNTNTQENTNTNFTSPSESLIDRASKVVVLLLMAAAAVLLIYFIAFHPDADESETGILASGGVVVVSIFKQTLDKYIRLRFS